MKRRKNLGMDLKIDISKAYDKVRRDFLFSILNKLGFNENVITIIKNVVNTVMFLVLIIGLLVDSFLPPKVYHKVTPYYLTY